MAAPTLALGFSADDFVHLRVLDAWSAGTASVDVFGLPDLFRFVDPARDGSPPPWSPWWSTPEIRIAFWRPLSALLALVDHRLFAASPLGWHVHSLLWLAAMTASATALLRRLLPSRAGVWASWIFALEDGHWVPTAWLANRNALVAATMAFAAVHLHLRWQEDGERWALPLLMGCFALALGAGELALGAMFFVLAWALWQRRLASLWPWAAVVVPWALLYRGAGYGSAHSGFYIDPLGEPLRWASRAWSHLPALAGASLGGTSTDLFTWQQIHPLWPALIGLAWIWVAWRLATRSIDRWSTHQRAALSWVPLGALLALLPVASTWPFDRLLVLADLGTAVVLGIALHHQAGRWLSKLFLGVLAAVHLWAAPISWYSLSWGAWKAEQQRSEVVVTGGGPVMLLNASDPFVSWFRPSQLGQHWELWSAVPEDHTLSRPAADRLCLRPHGGAWLVSPFEQLWAHPWDPPPAGVPLERASFVAEVVETDSAGVPREVCFTLRDGVDAVTLLTWSTDGLERVVPPEVGQQRLLRWAEGPTGL